MPTMTTTPDGDGNTAEPTGTAAAVASPDSSNIAVEGFPSSGDDAIRAADGGGSDTDDSSSPEVGETGTTPELELEAEAAAPTTANPGVDPNGGSSDNLDEGADGSAGLDANNSSEEEMSTATQTAAPELELGPEPADVNVAEAAQAAVAAGEAREAAAGYVSLAAAGVVEAEAETPTEAYRQAEVTGMSSSAADSSNSMPDGAADSNSMAGNAATAAAAAAGSIGCASGHVMGSAAATPTPAQAVAELLRLESVAARQQQEQQGQQGQTQAQASSNAAGNTAGSPSIITTGNPPAGNHTSTTTAGTGTPIQVRVQLRSPTTGQPIPLSSLPPSEQARHQSQIMALLRNDPNLQAAIARNASRQRRHEEFGDGGGGGGGGIGGNDASGGISSTSGDAGERGTSLQNNTAPADAATAPTTTVTPTPLADATNTVAITANPTTSPAAATSATAPSTNNNNASATTARSSPASSARSLATGVLNPLDPRGPTCQEIIAQADADRAFRNLQHQRLVQERQRAEAARRGGQQQQQHGQQPTLAEAAAAGTRASQRISYRMDRDQRQMAAIRAAEAERDAAEAERDRMLRQMDLIMEAEAANTGQTLEQVREQRRLRRERLLASVDAEAARMAQMRGQLNPFEVAMATAGGAGATGRTRAAGHNRPIGRDPETGREGPIAVDPVTGQRVYGFHPGRHIYYPDVDDTSEEANARREELRAMEERGGISRGSSTVASGTATPRGAASSGGSETAIALGTNTSSVNTPSDATAREDPGALPPGLETNTNTDGGAAANIVEMRRRRMAEMERINAENERMNSEADAMRANINRLRSAIDAATDPTAAVGAAPAAAAASAPGNATSNTGTPSATPRTFGSGMEEMQRQIQRLRELQDRTIATEAAALRTPTTAASNGDPLRPPTERPGLRMTFGGAAGNTATITGLGPGRPGTASAPQVPPLEAQPLPFPHRHYRAASSSNGDDGDSKPAADGSGDDDNGALDEFECKICFEILHEPRGCGKCINRFCKECLEQVWKTGSARAMNTTVANLDALGICPQQSRKSGKCPCCREPFSLTDMVADEALVKRMSDAGKVICPFPGCSDEIRLTDLKAHEASCGCQPVKCKFASYGCDWTGVRKDLATHENCDCPYGKISKLVEEVRTLKAGHEQQVAQMQQSLTRVMHQVQFHRSGGAGGGAYGYSDNRDPANLLDAFEFAALCISYPTKILQNKFCWNKFSCTSSQARLVNICTVMPLLIWSLRIICGSIKRCLYIDRMTDQEHQLAVVEDLILSVATLPIIGCFAFGFLHDKKFSRAWTTYKWTLKIPGVDRRWPIFRDTTALAATAMVALSLEDGTNGLTIHGVFLWAVVVTLTCFYSVIFDYISEIMFVNPGRRNTQSVVRPRAQRPVIFGLRYGIVAYACNFQLSFIDAVILVRLAKSLLIGKLPVAVTVESTECFFCEFTGKWKLWSSIAAIRIAMILAVTFVAGMEDICVDTQLWGIDSPTVCFSSAPRHFLNICFDLIILISVNAFISAMMKLAETFAKYLYKERNPPAGPWGNRNGPRNADYGIGALAFVGWVASIGVLLFA